MSQEGYPSEPGTGERIRDTAAALFRQEGFNGTSMQDLATAVGITKSSLYYHYASKQALLADIIASTMNLVIPLVRETAAATDLPVSGRLHRSLVLHVEESILERDYVACFAEEGRYLSSDFMAIHQEKKDQYERLFRDMIEEGIDKDEFLAQDSALAAMAILGMCDGLIRRYRPTGDRLPNEIATVFADTALRGLGQPGVDRVAVTEVAR